LQNIFSKTKADIPIYFVDSNKAPVIPKFMFDRIKNAQATYEWLDATTAGNFKLALRGKAIDGSNMSMIQREREHNSMV
jgi:hypothetical protein